MLVKYNAKIKIMKKLTFIYNIGVLRKKSAITINNICFKELIIRPVVLLYNTRYKKNITLKLSFKWLGLY